MNKYFAITIGPLIRTLSMARKPRELWSASYMFSKLMGMLIAKIPENSILSPLIVSEGVDDVGLYPDRAYFKSPTENWDINKVINKIRNAYACEIGVSADYFRIYAVEIEAENDNGIIKKLNERLDCLELFNIALPQDAENSVINAIIGNKIWEKYHKSEKQIETLAEIASAQLEQIDADKYRKIHKDAKTEEKETGKDELIKKMSKNFTGFITPHKYICIVHADGDNIGKIIKQLPNEKLKPFSDKLLKFGQSACESVKNFQGFPIYAGGDDLLFIAPVVSNNKANETQTIFDLIKQIDRDFEATEITQTTIEENGNTITPSMSYGVSITYYKYPLYEALKMSRDLLFDVAKEMKKEGKNAIAWTIQKGSGTAVTGVFSKSSETLYKAYQFLIESINVETDKNLVSAVAHKIKDNEELLGLFMGTANQNERLDAFFKSYLEYETKKADEKIYLDAVKELFKELQSETNNIKETIKIIYAMLRTAKFIKGLEDDKDE